MSLTFETPQCARLCECVISIAVVTDTDRVHIYTCLSTAI